MKYYIDTEFHEYSKQIKVAGIKVDKPIPTIDLISIGIISEGIDILKAEQIHPGITQAGLQNGTFKLSEVVKGDTSKEYYAICKEFNLKDAWYSNQGTKEKPNYWLRENVLKSIYNELLHIYIKKDLNLPSKKRWDFKEFKYLINKYGKTKKEIAEDIIGFTYQEAHTIEIGYKLDPIEFYAYFADYDWVVFAQLFGNMINLPEGFPKYCKDLKQILDEKANSMSTMEITNAVYGKGYMSHDVFKYAADEYPQFNVTKVGSLKSHPDYPKQDNEHNALDDAKWNKKLHEFLKSL